MKEKRVYLKVKQILIRHPETRDSDKKLIWLFWVQTGKATYGKYVGNIWQDGMISQVDFMNATLADTITRCRRKLQERFIHLQPRSTKVRKARRIKARKKGTHIYGEKIT